MVQRYAIPSAWQVVGLSRDGAIVGIIEGSVIVVGVLAGITIGEVERGVEETELAVVGIGVGSVWFVGIGVESGFAGIVDET